MALRDIILPTGSQPVITVANVAATLAANATTKKETEQTEEEKKQEKLRKIIMWSAIGIGSILLIIIIVKLAKK